MYYKKVKNKILQYKSLWNQGLASVFGGIIRKVRKLSEQGLKRGLYAVRFLHCKGKSSGGI